MSAKLLNYSGIRFIARFIQNPYLQLKCLGVARVLSFLRHLYNNKDVLKYLVAL